ncbi:MAG TPA: serine hydrolase [Dongiaceae bacterium]
MATLFAVKTGRGSLSPLRTAVVFALSLLVLALGSAMPVEARPVQASIVVDARTGEVLQASNPDASTYPASLTKMMTLYLLFEAVQDGRVKLTDTITFSSHAAGMPATNLNVDKGDRISVETAILAMIVRSANDAAVAVAEHLGATESGFARLMTNKAERLGMTHTEFRNANGLPDRKQRTTARDMATLSIALIRDFPQFYGYFKRTSFQYHGVNYSGHNKLLKTFAGYDGIKTGYIRAAGFNLASSAERDGRRLVVVYLGGKSPSMRDRRVADLLTYGFRHRHGTGVLMAARIPTKAQVKPVAEAPANSPASSPVDDVIANILVKPAEADVIAKADEPAAGFDLVALRGLAPVLKPGTGSASFKLASAQPLAPSAAVTTVGMQPMLKPGTTAGGVQSASASGAAPDSQATTIVWTPNGDYGIQVGAYSKYRAAQKAAQTAAKSEAELLADARIIIDSQKMNNGGKVYRARMAGLSKGDAQTACRNLKAKRTDCLVLKLDPTLAMGN